jgi:spore germination cell wall hydrolase CwlJ-like protein
MKTIMHFWSYLAQFSLEWEMFQTKVVEKIKTHIFSKTYFENISF